MHIQVSILFLSLFCANCALTSSQTTQAAQTRSTETISELEWELFDLLNNLRAVGFTCPDGTYFPPNSVKLVMDCRQYQASYLHSEDMAENNYFDHAGLD